MRVLIIGQGYVGLTIAIAASRKHQVIGYDINHSRIAELQKGKDRTLECSPEELKKSKANKLCKLLSHITQFFRSILINK